MTPIVSRQSHNVKICNGKVTSRRATLLIDAHNPRFSFHTGQKQRRIWARNLVYCRRSLDRRVALRFDRHLAVEMPDSKATLAVLQFREAGEPTGISNQT
jgi:hypothetical protein